MQKHEMTLTVLISFSGSRVRNELSPHFSIYSNDRIQVNNNNFRLRVAQKTSYQQAHTVLSSGNTKLMNKTFFIHPHETAADNVWNSAARSSLFLALPTSRDQTSCFSEGDDDIDTYHV
jgi:hypothetical protein